MADDLKTPPSDGRLKLVRRINLIDQLAKQLSDERGACQKKANRIEAKTLNSTQRSMIDGLEEVRNSKAIGLILEAEQVILKNYLAHHCNSDAMQADLSAALVEIAIIIKLNDTVRNPKAYEVVNQCFTFPQNRLGGLPYDEARQCFKSHTIRLRNLLLARLSDTEKSMIEARIKNIRMAWKKYITLQKISLGFTSIARPFLVTGKREAYDQE